MILFIVYIVSPALPPSSSIITNPGSNSVSIGTDTCISAGSSVMLSCQLTVSSSSVEPFTRNWTRDGTTIDGSSVTIPVTQSGTYKCTVSNECGMAMGHSNVICKSNYISHIIINFVYSTCRYNER